MRDKDVYKRQHYDRDKVKDVVYNGQYMLGVGESEVAVTQYQNNSYAIDVFTDNPGGWKATVTAGSDWLKFEGGALSLIHIFANREFSIPDEVAPTETERKTL